MKPPKLPTAITMAAELLAPKPGTKTITAESIRKMIRGTK